ncbi:hypothetical protein A2U01_0020260, partial [Trifolium medium]|nr:hypothetical protein [Trifolium medium]
DPHFFQGFCLSVTKLPSRKDEDDMRRAYTTNNGQ